MTEERETMLLVERGVPGVRVIPLDQQVCMLGASPGADVFLDNSYVSRMHAQIVGDSGRFIIRDLDSRNGTYVNGTRLGSEGHTLQSGDLIELAEGEVRLRFQSRGSTLSLKLSEGAERGELFVDPKSRDVWVRGIKLEPPLSRKEFDVLSLLFGRKGEACSKDEIAAAGWPERAGDVGDQEIEQSVRRLRLRIEPDPPNPRFVVTVRGYGYKHPG